MSTSTALVARPTSSMPGNAPMIVFNGPLTDKQFMQLTTLFTEPPPTKPNLLRNPAWIEMASEVAAELDAHVFTHGAKNARLFGSNVVANHFDGAMIELIRDKCKADRVERGEDADVEITEDEETITFSADEWFNDTRGKLPDELLKWDPQGKAPMPVWRGLMVDWVEELIKMEKEYPGFTKLLNGCFELEKKIQAKITAKRYQGSLAWNEDDKDPNDPEYNTHLAGITPAPPGAGLFGDIDRAFDTSALLSGYFTAAD